MKIAIAGAGAMGSRFGLMLHQSGNEVLLIDGWAEHVQQIKEHGLQANFNGKEVEAKLPIVLQSEVEKEDQVDLIILFTKAMQLEKNAAGYPIINQKRYRGLMSIKWYRA